jgi:hypothetical protein
VAVGADIDVAEFAWLSIGMTIALGLATMLNRFVGLATAAVAALALSPTGASAAWRKAPAKRETLSHENHVGLKLHAQHLGGPKRVTLWKSLRQRWQARSLSTWAKGYAIDQDVKKLAAGGIVPLLERTEALQSGGKVFEMIAVADDGLHLFHRSDGNLTPEHLSRPSSEDPVNQVDAPHSAISYDVRIDQLSPETARAVWRRFAAHGHTLKTMHATFLRRLTYPSLPPLRVEQQHSLHRKSLTRRE